MGYQKVNLSELLSGTEDAEQLHRILSDFSCPYNKDVEDFLHTKAIEFTRQGYSATYLIFASYQNHPVLVGYFALAPKFFHINLKNTSKTLGKRIRKFARYDEGMKRHLVSSILIGQLGKNYTHGYDALIRGEELLKIACDTVREAQRITGGRLVYLECEDVPSLIRFYKENGFSSFGTRELDGDEKDAFSGKHLIKMVKYLKSIVTFDSSITNLPLP